jgi:hypothetical protein
VLGIRAADIRYRKAMKARTAKAEMNRGKAGGSGIEERECNAAVVGSVRCTTAGGSARSALRIGMSAVKPSLITHIVNER